MKYRLLIVDDEPGIVDMMRNYFESHYEVVTANSGSDALRKVSMEPDLILLDINMPDMDGLTVCRQIREYVSCPILFLTARVESSDKIMGFGCMILISLFRKCPKTRWVRSVRLSRS